MEQKLLNNSFVSPVSRSDGLDFSNDLVEVFELRDFIEKGPSGEPDDFVVIKKPVKTESYHLNKVLEERSRGCDLKSIIARVSQTGDTSLLNQRNVVYADAFKMPSNLSDAMEEGVKTSNYIDGLKPSEIEKTIELSKMSKDEFSKYIDGLVAEKMKSISDSQIKKEEVK